MNGRAKTFAPLSLRGPDLRDLLADCLMSPAQAAQFLQLAERTVFRWLAADSAPFSILALLWHESPRGRYECALDVGNEVRVLRGLAGALQTQVLAQAAQLVHLLSISETGAANDALPLHYSVHAQIQGVGLAVGTLRGNDGFAQVGTDGGVSSAGCDYLANEEKQYRAI